MVLVLDAFPPLEGVRQELEQACFLCSVACVLCSVCIFISIHQLVQRARAWKRVEGFFPFPLRLISSGFGLEPGMSWFCCVGTVSFFFASVDVSIDEARLAVHYTSMPL